MATLSITKSYADGTALFELDLDNIKNAVETFLNVTGINDDNIQAAGITASSKIIDGTITGAKLNSGIVDNSTIEIASNVVRVKDGGITPAKLSALANTSPVGSVQMFHTFNSTVAVPRGWMICNGDIINQTNYDAIHGSGAYTTDGIASSALLTKNLPNMTNRYATGVTSTTQDGSSAITAVGNSGNTINLVHDHNVDQHNHLWYVNNGASTTDTTFNSGGGQINIDSGTVKTSGSARLLEARAGASNPQPPSSYTNMSDLSVGTDTSLSSSQSIRPDSIQFLYILKVI